MKREEGKTEQSATVCNRPVWACYRGTSLRASEEGLGSLNPIKGVGGLRSNESMAKYVAGE